MTPRRIRSILAEAGLSEAAVARGGQLAEQTPDRRAWNAFLSRMLAVLGATLVLAGIVCAVAYNWDRVGRFGKFAVLELAIVATAVAGWRLLPRLSGQLSLLGAAVLVGTLLAVYGQTYQTGADPYGLFLTWAALILPWVVAAQMSLLWLLVLALVDVGLMLWWSQVVGTNELPSLPLAIASLHALALIAWEWQLSRPHPWLDERWAAQLVAATGFGALTIGSAVFIIEGSDAGFPGILSLILLAAAIAGAFHQYRRVRPDPLMVTVAGAAGMVLVAVVVGRVIFDWLDLGTVGFILMAAFVIAEITFGVRWFRETGGDARPAASG